MGPGGTCILRAMKTDAPGGVRRRLLKILVSIAATLMVCEVGWRVYLTAFASHAARGRYLRMVDLPREAFRYRPHHYLCYVLNEEYAPPDSKNRHNSAGFRGEEVSREKPDGVYRIACLGGSTTYTDYVDDHRGSYPHQLQTVLREEYGHEGVEVINAGVGGYTSWESLLNLQMRVLPFQPDLVIVYHGTNDVQARFVPPDTYVRDNAGYRRHWVALDPWWDRLLFIRYLGVQWGFSPRNALCSTVKVEEDLLQGPPERLSQNPPTYFVENLRHMIALCREYGAEIMLTSWAHSPHKGDYAATAVYQDGFRESNQAVAALAAQRGVPFFDFAAVMPLDDELWRDGRHVTEEGARRKAELFAAFIHENLLADG